MDVRAEVSSQAGFGRFDALSKRSGDVACQPRPIVPRNPGVVLPVVVPSIDPSVPELERNRDVRRPAVLRRKESGQNVVIPFADVIESVALMCVGVSEKSARENVLRVVILHADSVSLMQRSEPRVRPDLNRCECNVVVAAGQSGATPRQLAGFSTGD